MASLAFAGRIDTEYPVQSTEAGDSVDPETDCTDYRENADRSTPGTGGEDGNSYEGYREYCSGDAVVSADVRFRSHSFIFGTKTLVD